MCTLPKTTKKKKNFGKLFLKILGNVKFWQFTIFLGEIICDEESLTDSDVVPVFIHPVGGGRGIKGGGGVRSSYTQVHI